MKTIKVLLIAMLLVISGSTLQIASAQEKSEEETIKEQQLLKAIEEQKKAMAEQKKAQGEAELMFKEQDERLNDLMKDVGVKVEAAGRGDNVYRIYSPRSGRNSSFNDPVVFSSGNNDFYFHSAGDAERATWDFSRSVKESTFDKKYTFDVDKTVKNVVMSVSGDCKAGEIRIKIVMPDGKNYSDIVIDEFGNLNWRKSFTISETENQDKTGEWKFQVSSSKATGSFRISIQSN